MRIKLFQFPLVAPLLICLVAAIVPQVKAAPPIEIRLQVLDAQTHRPVKGRPVYISFSAQKGLWPPNSLTMTVHTGADGIATFAVSEPVLSFFRVTVRRTFPCETAPSYRTSDVIHDGVVTHWTLDKSKKQNKWCTANPHVPDLQKRPRTIVFLVHPMNRFAWAWRDTWE
jgi:hypothetical protein